MSSSIVKFAAQAYSGYKKLKQVGGGTKVLQKAVGMSFRVMRGRIWQGLPILRSPFSPQGSSTRGDALKASSPRDPGHILGQRPSPTESDARPGWGR